MKHEIGADEGKIQLNTVMHPNVQPDTLGAPQIKASDELVRWDELAEKIGEAWGSPRSSVELLDMLREEESQQ